MTLSSSYINIIVGQLMRNGATQSGNISVWMCRRI